MTKSALNLFKVGLVILFTLLAQGCKKEEITSYEVTRLDPPERNSATGEPVRLLAAIFSKGDSTWFFKLMGPASKLSTKTEEFETFVRTVRFGAEGSNPPIQWNAPNN